MIGRQRAQTRSSGTSCGMPSNSWLEHDKHHDSSSVLSELERAVCPADGRSVPRPCRTCFTTAASFSGSRRSTIGIMPMTLSDEYTAALDDDNDLASAFASASASASTVVVVTADEEVEATALVSPWPLRRALSEAAGSLRVRLDGARLRLAACSLRGSLVSRERAEDDVGSLACS